MSKAAILVGGRGRRMGGAVKPLIEIGGRRILDRQLEVLGELGFEVAVVGNRLEPFAGYGLAEVSDTDEVEGPLAGLIAALEWAQSGDVLVLAGDMPALDAAIIDEFRSAAAENPDVAVVAARVEGIAQPLHAVYRAAFADEWRRLATNGKHRSPSRILESGALPVLWIDDRVRRIDASGSAFRNVNQPADLT